MADITLKSVITDGFIMLLMCLAVFLFDHLAEPAHHGFFCNDRSLMHPYHRDTIPTMSLIIVGVVIPASTILYSEYSRSGRYSFNGRDQHCMPKWLLKCYRSLLLLAFGSATGQLLTEVAKFSIGRQRPYFLTVCEPMMPDGTTCANPINHNRYIIDMKCLGSDAATVREARISFPSGHSSYTTFSMIFCVIYLQRRLNVHGSKLLKHFVQFLLILIAWYVPLSRVADYKHHCTDVLVGGLLGTINAYSVMNFVDMDTDVDFHLARARRD